MSKTVEQFEVVKRLKYYEAAYNNSVKLIRASPSGSQAQIHLFNAAKYYQEKINSLRKELEIT